MDAKNETPPKNVTQSKDAEPKAVDEVSSDPHEAAATRGEDAADNAPYATGMPNGVPSSVLPPASGMPNSVPSDADADARPRALSFALPGMYEPLPRRGIVGLVDGLLKKPANVAWEITNGKKVFSRLLVVVVACMLVTGLVVGSFAGGFQLLAVPVKLALGFLLAALMCLPSLYILNCLSGSELSLREVFGAQLMGIATVGILLLGFAPIGWVFSQSTSSPVFMGVMYLIFFGLSCAFGLSLMKRVMSAMGGRPFRRAWLWNIVFVLVALQLSTTLRPLFGDFEGLALGEKTFFVEHWFDTMAPAEPKPGDFDASDAY